MKKIKTKLPVREENKQITNTSRERYVGRPSSPFFKAQKLKLVICKNPLLRGTSTGRRRGWHCHYVVAVVVVVQVVQS